MSAPAFARASSWQRRAPVARLSRLAAWALAFAAMAACNSFGSCRKPHGVAELVAAEGRVERAEGELASWREAAVGASFALGDAVRTGPASTARVRVGTGGFTLGSSSMVRFVASPVQGAATSLRVESGAAELEPVGEDLVVDTAVGVARLERNSRVRVEAGGGEAGTDTAGEPRLQVVLGRVVLERPGARALTVLAGQRMVVRVSGAPVIEPAPAATASNNGGTGRTGTAGPSASGTPASNPPTPAARDAGATVALNTPDAGAATPPVPGTSDAGAGATIVPPEAMVVALQGGRGGVTVLEPGAGPNGWQPMGTGRQRLPPGTRVRVPVGARLALRRGRDFRYVIGAADLVLGELSTPIASDAPREPVAPQGPSPANVAAGTEPGSGAAGAAGAAGTTGSGAGATAGATSGAAAAGASETGGGAAYIAAAAGESSLIHSTAAVTPVRVRVADRCPTGAVVQTAGRGALTARGTDAVVLDLGAGRHRYTVRCMEGGRPAARAVASGTLTIVRDTGDAVMPRRAPHSEVDADGRNYSVLYQNLLPEITFRWPHAPAGSSVVLHVRDRGGRDRRFERGPGDSEVGLTSGLLGEGTYRFWFTAGVQRTPETTLRIAFDNAARSASLAEPADTPLTPGSTVRVSGTALAGSTVSVGATRLPLDAQNRFRGEVPVPRGEAALTIRIAHPARGVQYYVRRIATAGGS